MIKEVFYTSGMTYIKDMKDVEITTNHLGFGKSFELAKNLNVPFNFDEINEDDMIGFSHYLQHYIGSCENRNIYNFFNHCNELGIQNIVGEDWFGIKGVKETIGIVVSDYNADVGLYNIECYGTDTYIAKIVYVHLKLASIYKKKDQEKSTKIYTLFKLVDNDEYNLDEFLNLLEIFNK